MYYVGIDIGGMSIKFGLVDEEGAIIYRTVLTVDYNEVSIEKTISLMKDKIEELCTGAKIHLKDIKGIGIGCPGVCNTDEGILVNAPNLKWQDVHIREMFADLRIPTFICNDANVALIGEATFGAGKGFKDLLLLTLGTGVGGGIIINERPFTGTHGMASEIGHSIIGENYYNCNCGANGCLETFCSATAIIKYAQKLIQEGNESIILDMADRNIESINAKMVFDAFRENDAVAVETINRFKNYLAKAMASMINTLDPDIISIGGGVSRASDVILHDIKDLVRENVLYKNEEFADIVCANLGADAGIIGAAFLQ